MHAFDSNASTHNIKTERVLGCPDTTFPGHMLALHDTERVDEEGGIADPAKFEVECATSGTHKSVARDAP